MKTIIIKTQKEFDKIKDNFEGRIEIIGDIEKINRRFDNAGIIVCGSATILLASGVASFLFVSGKAKIKTVGRNIVRHFKNETKIKLELSKETNYIVLDRLDWFGNNSIEKTEKIILYKKVSKDFKTQEGTSNETLWVIGNEVEHKNWQPEKSECGEGKFHACSRPFFCDEFRNETGDKYIAIEVLLEDTYEWPNPEYPHKIAFRKCKVLFECDENGKNL